MTGDVGRVRELLKAGYPAAEHDDDSWTPLHYAAWHGQASVVRVLMQDWQVRPPCVYRCVDCCFDCCVDCCVDCCRGRGVGRGVGLS